MSQTAFIIMMVVFAILICLFAYLGQRGLIEAFKRLAENNKQADEKFKQQIKDEIYSELKEKGVLKD